MATEILPSAIAAAAGLFGVAVGGYVTAHNQKRERQQRRTSDQLAEFYSPMLALRAQILTKSELRLKISGEAESVWRKMMERPYTQFKNEASLIDYVERLTKERSPDFERVIHYENRQLAEDIIPAYRKMVDLFTSKMHLAEFSTIQHFPALLEFVEIWNRWLDRSLPVEVLGQLNHSEEKLFPFYQDLADNFARLQGMLQEKRRWRRRPAVKVHGAALAVNPWAIPKRASETPKASD
jgi:hypothetical protein